ncbi:MAG: hypothetical protein J1G01_05830 [Clostridiales bacterium]|nr:hypothetical protein [Clostridiales bacterium]
MLDWSSIFNIVFVAAAAFFAVYFLIVTIAVAVKGKRKCNAFDVITRILATLVFIAAVGMLAGAILSMLDSGMYIVAATVEGKSAAVLVIGETATELPVPELFVALASSIGAELSVALFICSLAALIVDCLVANKKSEKKAKVNQVKQTKTAEQLKREAELERIRKIGESAVKKTNAAARTADQTSATEKPQGDEPQVSQAQEQAEPEQSFDWRETPKEQPHVGFVGIKDTVDDFDSFDDVPQDSEETNEEVPQDYDFVNGETDDVQADKADEAEEQYEEQSYEDENYEEVSDDEQDIYAKTEEEDGVVEDEEAVEEVVEEQAEEEDVEEIEEEFDEQTGEEAYEEEIETQAEDDDIVVDEGSDEEEVYEEEFEEEAEPEADGETPWYAVNGESEEEEDVYEKSDEQSDDQELEEVEDDGQDDEQVVEEQSHVEQPVADEQVDEHIEPNRGIYIPEIRTLTRQPEIENPNNDQSQEKNTPTATPKRQAQKQSTDSKPATGGAKRTAGSGTKSKPRGGAKSAAKRIVDEKKLPVTRRYVILDRRNAVNMFGEYLKERSKAEKDKLRSSISTIIIE